MSLPIVQQHWPMVMKRPFDGSLELQGSYALEPYATLLMSVNREFIV